MTRRDAIAVIVVTALAIGLFLGAIRLMAPDRSPQPVAETPPAVENDDGYDEGAAPAAGADEPASPASD
jgi:hypothetical protein